MNNKKHSQRQEHNVADWISLVDPTAYRVNNSGAPDFKCGDVASNYILLECKTKAEPQKQQILHKKWLEKIKEEAYVKDVPLSGAVVDFGIDGEDYYIVDKHDFINLLDAYIKMKEEENE